MSAVNMVFRKYDGSLHWHYPLRHLGSDEHGVWLGMMPGTVARRGHDHEHIEHRAGVMIVPRDAWWTAHFNDTGDIAVYCDISTVPEWRDDEVTMIDLDLDVVRRRDGTVFLDDADEFAEHQIKYHYPSNVITEAERTAEFLLDAVEQGTGPFGGAHERWLAAVDSE